jgi:hypothetical protein
MRRWFTKTDAHQNVSEETKSQPQIEPLHIIEYSIKVYSNTKNLTIKIQPNDQYVSDKDYCYQRHRICDYQIGFRIDYHKGSDYTKKNFKIKDIDIYELGDGNNKKTGLKATIKNKLELTSTNTIDITFNNQITNVVIDDQPYTNENYEWSKLQTGGRKRRRKRTHKKSKIRKSNRRSHHSLHLP